MTNQPRAKEYADFLAKTDTFEHSGEGAWINCFKNCDWSVDINLALSSVDTQFQAS